MSTKSVSQEETEHSIELLQKDRRIFKRDIVRIRDIINKWEQNPPSQSELNQFDPMVEQLNESKIALIRTDQRIIHLGVDLEDEKKAEKLENEMFKEIEDMNALVWTLKGKIIEIKRKLAASEPSHRESIASSTLLSESISSNPVRVKLPDIPVPKFDGNPRNFCDFRNLFESLIHNDSVLTSIQKFYFLRGALAGESESFLKGVNIVGNRYEQTWKDFCAEYGKKRLIISAHLFDLFNLSSIKNETGIRELVNSIDVAVRGLNQCGEETDSWSILLSYLLLSKLDYKTRSDFENTLTTNDVYPSYQLLRNFLNIRAANSTKRDLEKPGSERKPSEKKSSMVTVSSKTKCCICQAPHLLIDCPEFIKKSPAERSKSVSYAKLCANCFNRNHPANECRRNGCNICGSKHHRLLHIDKSESSAEKSESANPEIRKTTLATVSSLSSSACSSNKTVILPTAVVRIQSGKYTGSARVLLDSASELSCISDSFVSEQGINRFPSTTCPSIYGISGGSVNSTHECRLELLSRFGGFSIDIVANILPSSSFQYRVEHLRMGAVVDKLKLMTLADPAFTKPVVEIPIVNIIVGAKYFGKILGQKAKYKVVDGVELMLSNFGWVIIGEVNQPQR